MPPHPHPRAGMDDEPAAPDTLEESAEQEPSGRWLRTVLLLVGLSLGGTLGFLVVGPMVGETLAAGEQEGGGEKKKKKGKGGGYDTVLVINNLVVNPAGTGGRRFLLVSVALEPEDGDVERLEGLENKLRASLIPILSARTVEELLDLELRKELIREVTRTLEGIVGGEGLRKVFFPQFVIQ